MPCNYRCYGATFVTFYEWYPETVVDASLRTFSCKAGPRPPALWPRIPDQMTASTSNCRPYFGVQCPAAACDTESWLTELQQPQWTVSELDGSLLTYRVWAKLY